MNEFRNDPVTGKTVILSSSRDHRPQQYNAGNDDDTSRPDASDASASACPFCVAQMDTPPILARYTEQDVEPADVHPEAWDVCVVPNRYPVLDPIGNGLESGPAKSNQQQAFGVHEVVIESATHVTRVGDLQTKHFRLMLRSYRDRFLAMKQREGIRFGLAMKNSGRDAGASLKHTHSQIFGLQFVPEQVQLELAGARRYFEHRGCCVFCQLIEENLTADPDRSLVVDCSDSYVAWCPFASRFSYEVWLAPRRHISNFESSSDSMIEELAKFFQSIIGKVDQHPRIHAFNYLLHSLPFDSNRHDEYHWHIEILPRITKQAGFEWGTGVFINTVSPTQAAFELRQV